MFRSLRRWFSCLPPSSIALWQSFHAVFWSSPLSSGHSLNVFSMMTFNLFPSNFFFPRFPRQFEVCRSSVVKSLSACFRAKLRLELASFLRVTSWSMVSGSGIFSWFEMEWCWWVKDGGRGDGVHFRGTAWEAFCMACCRGRLGVVLRSGVDELEGLKKSICMSSWCWWADNEACKGWKTCLSLMFYR